MNTIEKIQHVRDIDPDYPACTVTLKGRIEGDIDALLQRESQWMSRLGTHEPMGLNSSCNELGRIHCKLFSKTN